MFLKHVLPFFHPILMWVLFATSLYALYLGIQVARYRTSDEESRRALTKRRFALRHYMTASALLALMVLGTLTALLNVYLNTGKLIGGPGPHLAVGLSMVGLIATMAALTPWMQQGRTWARYTHTLLSLVLVGLFCWQSVTGTQIMVKMHWFLR